MEKFLKIKPDQNAFIKYEDNKNHFVVLSTFVDPSLRGQGIAQKLYQEFIQLVNKENGTFSSKCSYVTSLALRDQSVQKIYKKNI